MAETKKLKRLKAIRNSHRNVVNNLLQETNELICVENQKGRIEVISTLFENKLKTLNEIDQEILNVCELTTINNFNSGIRGNCGPDYRLSTKD